MYTYAFLSLACFMVAVLTGGFGYALLAINPPCAYLFMVLSGNCAFLSYMFARTAIRLRTQAAMTFISY